MNKSRKKLYTVPILGFMLIILVGAVILKLPICNKMPINFIDSLFVATSGVCVTGFTTVVISEQFNFLGQLILLTLIEIGALGFMTFIIFVATIMQKKITVSEAMLLDDGDFNGGFKQKVKNIIKFTFIIQLVGAILLSLRFIPEYGFTRGLWYSIFHSASAFCNSGFDILGRNSFIGYTNDYYVNFIIMTLIILGGIGFLVLEDLIIAWKKKSFKHLRFQSKIVLSTTGILLAFSILFIWIMEPQLTLLQAMFLAVNLRTSGLSSINVANCTEATKIICTILMFIGGAPASTSGGIRIVTFAILMLATLATLRNRKQVVVFYRKINQTYIIRAITLTMLSVFIVIVAIINMSFSCNLNLEEIIFHCVSAYSMTGLGLFPASILNFAGKINTILLMFIGRVGPIVFLRIFFAREKQKDELKYAEGELIL